MKVLLNIQWKQFSLLIIMKWYKIYLLHNKIIARAKYVQKYKTSTVHWNFKDKDFQLIYHSSYNFILTQPLF